MKLFSARSLPRSVPSPLSTQPLGTGADMDGQLILKRAPILACHNTQDILSRSMRCEVCKRELAKGEAVHRVVISHSGDWFSLFHGNIGSVCTDCAAPIAERKWFAKSCSNCQRSTLFHHVRKNLRYFFCSSECRQTFFYARRRQRTKPRLCKICGQNFTPQDDRPRYCSLGCKLEAFRRRAVIK